MNACSQRNRLASAGSGDQFDATKRRHLCYDYVTITLFFHDCRALLGPTDVLKTRQWGTANRYPNPRTVSI